MRDDLACEEFEAATRRLAVGPVDAADEESAEAAGPVHQLPQVCDGHVGGSDDAGAGGVDAVDELVVRHRLDVGQQGRRDGVVVVEEAPDLVAHLVTRLTLGLGHMHVADECPVLALHPGAGRRGLRLDDLPGAGQLVEADGRRGAKGEQAQSVPAGQLGARRRDRSRNGDRDHGPGVTADVQLGVPQLEPLGLAGDGFRRGQQFENRFERLLHARAEVAVVDPHHLGVGDQRAGTDSEDAPSPRHVVEEDHPVGHHQRVVVGQGDHPRAEPDPAGALRRGSDHQLGHRRTLVATGVVLTEPDVVVPKPVEQFDGLKVALDRQGMVVQRAVVGRHEAPEP